MAPSPRLVMRKHLSSPHDSCHLARKRAHDIALAEPIPCESPGTAAVKPIRGEFQTIRPQLQHGFLREEAVRSPQAQSSTKTPCTAGIRDERVVLDAHGMLTLQYLYGRIGKVLGRICNRIDTVLVGTPAPAAADHIDDDEGPVVGMAPAKTNNGISSLSRRRHDVRHYLRKRPEHGVHDAIAG